MIVDVKGAPGSVTKDDEYDLVSTNINASSIGKLWSGAVLLVEKLSHVYHVSCFHKNVGLLQCKHLRPLIPSKDCADDLIVCVWHHHASC